MSQLSPFQEKCGDELKQVLRNLGREPRKWEVITGRTQTYIKADLVTIKVWIYTDGADWDGCGKEGVFEAPDFDSLDDLQQAFVKEVVAALTASDCGDNSNAK